MSKVDELTYDRGFAYSDEGQLVGHLVMAVGLLEGKVAEAEKLSGEPIPRESILRLKHMIVSHHGEYEFGSPKLPMTLEAIALAYLDNLDAKLASFAQQLRDDPNVDSPWTAYNANLRRKLYKGGGGGGRGVDNVAQPPSAGSQSGSPPTAARPTRPRRGSRIQ